MCGFLFILIKWSVLLYGLGAVLRFLLKKFYYGTLDTKNEENITDKVVIVTGANSGTGKAAALGFAQRGAKVIMACRSESNAKEAENWIRTKTWRGELIFMKLDLSSLASVREFVKEFTEKFDKLDILVNNAGLVGNAEDKMKTKDGFEIHMGVHHVAHFLLTNLLLESLKKAKSSRVVTVSSFVHSRTTLDVDDLFSEKKPVPKVQWPMVHHYYSRSKLANALVSASELNSAQYSYRFTWPLNYAPFYFTPVAEPEPTPDSSNTPFLTKSPLAVLEDNSKIQNVPWMVGVTEDEGCSLFSGLVLKKPELTEELDRDWNELLCPSLHLSKFLSGPEEELILAKKIRKFYFGNDKIGFDTRDNLTNMYSDSLISYGVYRSALKVAGREDRKEPVYLYQYAYPGPVSIFGLFYELTEKEAKMVGHGDELTHQFILGETFAKEDPTEKHDSFIKPDSQDEEFSKNFVKLWASFAINGKPTHTWGEKSSTKWSPISKQELKGEAPLKWYRIEQDPHYREDLYKERMQFWREIYEEHILQKPFMKNSFKKTEL